MRFLVLTILTFCSLNLWAQDTKREQEQRLPADQVPETSQAWLEQAFQGVKKVKWYREITSGKTSFEAKFKDGGHRYSVEFSVSGVVEDVEKKVTLGQLPANERNLLKKGFSQLKKFKLVKIQEQWTAPTSEALLKAIQSNDPGMATIRYEVEFRAEIDGVNSLWEGLFDQSGTLLSKRRVQLRPTDNLDY